jgi:hypothetical protein
MMTRIQGSLGRRSMLAGSLAYGVAGLDVTPSNAQAAMKSVPNELPWKDSPDAVACNLALANLVLNLPRRLTVGGRIHAETYISAVGAIAGYAAQRTLFAKTPPVMGVNINRVTTKSGGHYWFGDSLNFMLVPKTNAEANRCVWPLAVGGAISAGVQAQQIPPLVDMFRFVASTIGGPDEGKSSVPADHQAQLPARDLLKSVWPLAIICFSGKLPSASGQFPGSPVAWWSAIAAQASSRPIKDVAGVLPPAIALPLLMEAAIYCSKLEAATVEG